MKEIFLGLSGSTDAVADVDYVVAQSTESAPGALRWKDGVLQQEWRLKQFMASGAHKEILEWRDVPTVDEPE